jgi:sialate O-acetylesterase
MMKKLLFSLLLTSALHAAPEKLWLPAILGDHMVLPVDRAVLWGEDKPGQAVTVAVAGKSAGAVADARGSWRVQLSGLKAGGPYALTVTGSEERTLQDVLLGEVWLGSGQSNMEFDLRRSDKAEEALKTADKPQLRLFTVERVAGFEKAHDVQGQWKASTPETAGPFSAVLWHYGALRQAASKKPVGLVCAAWGGTPGEAWVPRAELDKLSGTADLVAGWDKDADRIALWKDGAPFELELSALRLERADGSTQLLRHAGDVTRWQHSEKPGSSGSVELVSATGSVRYSGKLQGGAWGGASVPFDLKGEAVDLRAYKAVVFEARGHGKFVPAFTQASIKDYDYYCGAMLTPGEDWAEVRLPLDQLKQGGWGLSAPLTLDAIQRLQFGPQVPFWPDVAEVAYNGMVAPLQPFGFKGVLWYQGESNSGRPKDYAALLRSLAGAWRRGFEREDLFFAVVQLPEYKGDAGWIALQAAQADAVKGLKDAVLVKAEGLGDPNDIHPRRKAEVGQRLFSAIQALRKP